jgi:ectoine hydroxylase-related dioxygenase (phytanoyl-CoA dioxygenase family)
MNCQQIAAAFHNDGFALIRDVFSLDEMAEIGQRLNDFIDKSVPDMASVNVYYEDAPGAPIKALHNLEVYSPYFRDLANDARLLKIMHAIWPKAEIIPHGLMFFGKAAHSGSSAPPHQDNAFQNLCPPEDLVCTLAIDRSTPENGALTVHRGSHKAGRLRHRASGVMGFSQTLLEPLSEKEYPSVQLCMNPGDICLHHTNTVHFSGPNNTDKSRRQLGIGYRTSRARLDEQAWTDYQSELAKLHASAATS